MDQVNNVLSRSRLLRLAFDRRRDIDDECGYPRTEEITVSQYRYMYEREAVAARVVDIYPLESWQTAPTVYETEDPEDVTPFEEAWQRVLMTLGVTERSWNRSSTGSFLWNVLRRLDCLAGIGHFGILLLGFDDGKPLHEPVEPRQGMKLIYLQPYDESLVQIVQFDNDPTSPRYGHPVYYQISMFNLSVGSSFSSVSPKVQTRRVHWTRVIHVADNLETSEVFGVPRMRPVWNRLMDLRKLYGGSAEMYWRGAFPGLSIEMLPQFASVRLTDEERQRLRDEIEQYMNGLQRYLALAGMRANALAPQVVDPRPQIQAHIEAIAIRLGVPIRIFVGSERGELASSQDERAWRVRLQQRREQYITPRIIAPLVDRLIHVGVLPEPAEGYTVQWPDITTATEKERVDIAVRKTEALAKYVQGGVAQIISPVDYLVNVLDFTEEEAISMLQRTLEEEESVSPVIAPQR